MTHQKSWNVFQTVLSHLKLHGLWYLCTFVKELGNSVPLKPRNVSKRPVKFKTTMTEVMFFENWAEIL